MVPDKVTGVTPTSSPVTPDKKFCESENLPVIQNEMDSLAKMLCGRRNLSDYTNLWPLLKPIEVWKILFMKLK